MNASYLKHFSSSHTTPPVCVNPKFVNKLNYPGFKSSFIADPQRFTADLVQFSQFIAASSVVSMQPAFKRRGSHRHRSPGSNRPPFLSARSLHLYAGDISCICPMERQAFYTLLLQIYEVHRRCFVSLFVCVTGHEIIQLFF